MTEADRNEIRTLFREELAASEQRMLQALRAFEREIRGALDASAGGNFARTDE